MNCVGCKFADWKRTSNGRLHPDKTGNCTYSTVVQVPQSSVHRYFPYARDREKATDGLKITGAFIERGYQFDHCPTRVETESENG